MSDSYTTNLNMTKPEVGASDDTWGTKDNANLDTLDAVFAADGSGTGVGLQASSGKTWWVRAGAFLNTVAASLFIVDGTDTSKAVTFDASGITTGTTRTFAFPDTNMTFVGTAATQTLTNKTLTDCVADTQTLGDTSTKLATMAAVTAAANAAQAAAIAGTWTTGDIRMTLRQSAYDATWLMMDDSTIGSASSGATHAGSQYQNLYSVLWAISDTYAPVTGGRGANAAADWSANKPIALTKVLGRALAVAGSGSSLTARSLGQTLGEETHVLVAAEMPSHVHSSAGPTTVLGGSGGGTPTYGSPGSGNTGSTGGDGAHNNMQPTSFLNIEIKL